MIQAFSNVQDHLDYISVRLIVAAVVEKCFKLSDGSEDELKQQNNYFQNRIKRVVKIIGIDKTDQDKITAQVKNLDEELAKISKEVTSKLEDRERRKIQEINQIGDDLADVEEVTASNNDDTGFFQDIPVSDEEDDDDQNQGGNSNDDDSNTGND